MRKLVNDLTGKKFGRLYVLGVNEDNSRKIYYNCICDCGNAKKVRSDSLTRGCIKSCGCLKKEQDRINLEANHSHKQSGTRIYQIWQGMKSRCYNKNNSRYSNYGGKGVVVCEEWKEDFSKFYEWAINNCYSDKLTIDRIDVNGNYEPDNCRWADHETQCNNRTTNIKITIGNATKTLKEWCDIFEVDYHKTNARFRRNGFESIERLFNNID